MTVVRLAAQERLIAAFASYDAVWSSAGRDMDVAPARLELCSALLDCGEELPPSVLEQMERDRAVVAQLVVVTG